MFSHLVDLMQPLINLWILSPNQVLMWTIKRVVWKEIQTLTEVLRKTRWTILSTMRHWIHLLFPLIGCILVEVMVCMKLFSYPLWPAWSVFVCVGQLRVPQYLWYCLRYCENESDGSVCEMYNRQRCICLHGVSPNFQLPLTAHLQLVMLYISS